MANTKTSKNGNDAPESIYNLIEQVIQSKVCPNFSIFHEGSSARGNGWGKFVVKCSKCVQLCDCTISSRHERQL